MLRKKKMYAGVVGLSALLMAAGMAGADENKNIVKNPSAEKVDSKGRPIMWGLYKGKGKPIWGTSTEEFHSGKRSVFIRPTEYEVITASCSWQGMMQVNCAVLVGSSDGHRGYLGNKKAYKALPNTEYHFSLWLKSNGVDKVMIKGIGWNTEEAQSQNRQFFKASPHRISLTEEWQQYKGVFTTKPDTKKFALQIWIDGLEDRGAKVLGTVYIDDVVIYPSTDALL